MRLGEWYFETKKYDSAVTTLAGLPAPKAQKLVFQAKLDALSKDQTKQKIDLLKQALNKFPEEVESMMWLYNLSETDAKATASYAKKAEENLPKIDVPAKLDEAGYTRADVYSMMGEVWNTLGNQEKSQKAYSVAADAYGDMAKKSTLKVSRGPNLERAYCLGKAGRNEEAAKLYESMIEAYPKEFTFNYSYANVLFKLKQFEKALPFSDKAVEFAYGDNWLRAVNLNAKINVALKKFETAEKNVKTALEKTSLPVESNVRTHQLYSQLQTMLSEIESQKKKN